MNDQASQTKIDTLQDADLYRLLVRERRNYAIFMLDTQGVVTSWNGGVEALLGFTEQDWVGQHASIIFTPADQAVEICRSEMTRAEQAGSSTDIRWHRRKDGSEFFANGYMNVVRDPTGNLMGYAKIMSDETARKQLQDSLTESNAALEQFAYVASHDLQEPLRTMRMYAEMLTRNYQGKLGEDADEFLSYIVTAAERMNLLVSDLLAYARVTTEQARPSSVALDEDFEAALTQLEALIKESGASVTHGPLPKLQVDRGHMVRLFQNLIGNAIKYRKPGQGCNVHVSAEQSHDEWTISVVDDGIGFDQQYAASVFTPFKRLHNAEEYPGTGVGLTICQRIVRMQGGRIWAESELGKGATFRFTLPVRSEAPLEHTPRVDSGLSNSRRPEIDAGESTHDRAPRNVRDQS